MRRTSLTRFVLNRASLGRVAFGCCAFWLLAGSSAQDLAPATNLRVLPKDTSPADIKILMEEYAQDLGVKCEHCHSTNPRTRQLDYAADDNPAKQTARVMIAMLEAINNKYLAQLDDRKYAVLVSCGNCHQGQADPPTFDPLSRPAANLRAGGE